MLTTLAVCTLAVAVATLLPFWRNPHWMVRVFDFPRMQIAVLAFVLLVAQLVFLDLSHTASQLLVLITALCLGAQLWWILPYTAIWPTEVKTAGIDDPTRTITFLTSNVLTPNRNATALISLVREHKPDVLVTLESDQWWQDQLAVLEADMPFTIQCPLDNLYGMHVYSRLPLLEKEVAYLVEDDVPSMHALVQLGSGDRVRAHFVHPAPPSPTENEESAERDAELVMVARSVVESNQPIIVTGDLNDVAWSPTTRLFCKISGLLDPRVGRGMYSTFHANYPFMRWPLDHIFHSKHFTVRTIRRLPSIGSDHFPLLASVVYVPHASSEQEAPEADTDDREWAEQIAQQEGADKHDVPEPGLK